MKTRYTLPLLLLLGVGLSRCTLVSSEDEPVVLRSLSAEEQRVVSSDNRFGLKLFRALNADAPEENLFISPLSVSMALGMTLNGANGETRQAMEETLELAGLTEEQINAAYRSLIDLLTQLDPDVAFTIANSIWHRDDFAVEPAFVDVNRRAFDAEVRALDFGAPEAPATINRWVEDATNGKIDRIIDAIGPDMVMFLINAIYFKGTWTYAFDASETTEKPFTNLDGTVASVPMMRQQASLPYLATETFEAVDLPYGDSLFSMTVLLPRPGVDVNELVAQIDQAQWDAWTGQFRARSVDLQLPRFELAYEKKLNDVLTALGMGVAFTGAADFTGIHRAGGLKISFVKHKSFVEVNEEGTEAAAVTVVGIELTSAGGTARVHVDRPFVFVIRERHSGTLLFTGKVASL